MYRGRVFIGDGSPTTLRYYTVIPPNNYIPGIFSGHNRIFTSLSRLHLGRFLPLGPITAHRAQVRTSSFGEHDPFAASEVLALLRLPLLVFDFANGALAFASLRLPSSSPLAPWSSPLFASLSFTFAFGALVFASLRSASSSPLSPWSSPLFARLAEPAEDLVVAFKLCAGLRSMVEGDAPNTRPPRWLWRGAAATMHMSAFTHQRPVYGVMLSPQRSSLILGWKFTLLDYTWQSASHP